MIPAAFIVTSRVRTKQTELISDDEALAVVVLEREHTHAVEGNNDLGGRLLADVGQLHVTVQGDSSMCAQVIEQYLLTLTIADGFGSMFLGALGFLAQDSLMQPAGKDVLIGYTVIYMPVAVVIGSLDWLLRGLGNVGLDHRLAIDIKHLEAYLLLGATIHLCRCLDHVDFLLASHPGDVAVVLHADEQMATAIVGKGSNGARNLAGIGNLVLEILMLMLALKDKVLYVMALLGFHFNKLLITRIMRIH